MNQSIYYREELLNSLCSNVDDLFLIYHLGKRVIEYVSPNTERIYGISGRNFRKNPFIFLNHTNVEFKEEMKRLFTSNIIKSHFETEFQLNNPKTHQINWLIFRVYPVYHWNNVIRYIICISDLTKEKQSQQLLKEALLNAQKANEAKKDFLSHMSHEIKTPINAIMGMTQIAANSLEDKGKVEKCLDKISEASGNLIAIVNNILEMAKIDSNNIMIASEQFSLLEFLNNFTEMISSQAELNHLRFDLKISNLSINYLLGDALRLSQVLSNCISNSLKFTQAGGSIKLVVTEGERYGNKVLYRFAIIDNGKGMSEEYVNRIFIPFEQEDSSIAQKYGGSGLGMSITKNIVTLMEGNINVKSKPGTGTTITIDLPFYIPENLILTEETEVPMNEIKPLPVYDFSGYRILVVEDNEINLEIACEYLKFTKVSVDTAHSGLEAVKIFETSAESYYDLILMDIQMPDLNGYETTKRIRKSSHPNAKEICIAAMSADSYTEDIALTLESGMNYHIAKPIDINDFFHILDKILNKN